MLKLGLDLFHVDEFGGYSYLMNKELAFQHQGFHPEIVAAPLPYWVESGLSQPSRRPSWSTIFRVVL